MFVMGMYGKVPESYTKRSIHSTVQDVFVKVFCRLVGKNYWQGPWMDNSHGQVVGRTFQIFNQGHSMVIKAVKYKNLTRRSLWLPSPSLLPQEPTTADFKIVDS